MTSETRPIQLSRIAHVYYTHKDIASARRFAEDFGFVEAARTDSRTYFRGYGAEPFVLCLEDGPKDAFGGAAFAVDSLEELQRAAALLPAEARPTSVYDLGIEKGAPGGGKAVTFWDPVDGFPMHLVWGQKRVPIREPSFPTLKVNYPVVKNRPVNQFQRFEKRPAPVHKLGHYGMCVTDFVKAYKFYTKYFNFHPSELVHDDAGVDKTVFFRLDRGDELVDHHCFFFFEGPEMHVHHSSFETHDFDTQVLGHDWLRHQGWKNCWGVGRHVMGSQIFDYWFDNAGFILEHYVDGDLLDMREPTHRTKAAPDNLHVWGPEVPATFLQ